MNQVELALLAQEAIETGALAESLLATRSISPLLDEFRRLEERNRVLHGAFGSIQIVTGMETAARPLTLKSLRDTVRKMDESYKSVVEWPPKEDRRFRTGDAKFNFQVETGILGGYLVPKEFSDQIIAELDIQKVIERQIVREIAKQMDDLFLYGRQIGAEEAIQEYYDDPAEASLTAVMPHARSIWTGVDFGQEMETIRSLPFSRPDYQSWDRLHPKFRDRSHPGLEYSRIRESGGILTVMDRSRNALASFHVDGVEIESQRDIQEVSLMGSLTPIRRLMNMRTKVKLTADLSHVLRTHNSMLPWESLCFRLDTSRLTYEFEASMSGVESVGNFLGYPAYSIDRYGPSIAEVTLNVIGNLKASFRVPTMLSARSVTDGYVVDPWRQAKSLLDDSVIDRMPITPSSTPEYVDEEECEDGDDWMGQDEDEDWEDGCEEDGD